jgi:hypothetical protein
VERKEQTSVSPPDLHVESQIELVKDRDRAEDVA